MSNMPTVQIHRPIPAAERAPTIQGSQEYTLLVHCHGCRDTFHVDLCKPSDGCRVKVYHYRVEATHRDASLALKHRGCGGALCIIDAEGKHRLSPRLLRPLGLPRSDVRLFR